MTLGEWLSTHPPLAKRMLALEPSLGAGTALRATGALRAAMVVGIIILPLVAGGFMAAAAMPKWMKQLETQAAERGGTAGVNPLDGDLQAERDSVTAHTHLEALGRYLESRRDNGQQLPRDVTALYALYHAELGSDAPVDPFDGERFGYEVDGEKYVLWSGGPDRRSETADDLNWRPGEGITRGR